MSFLVGKVVDGKEHRSQIPAPLAFCVTGTVEGSGDSRPGPGWCHAAWQVVTCRFCCKQSVGPIWLGKRMEPGRLFTSGLPRARTLWCCPLATETMLPGDLNVAMCREGGEKECLKLSKCLKPSKCTPRCSGIHKKGKVRKRRRSRLWGEGQEKLEGSLVVWSWVQNFLTPWDHGMPFWSIFRNLILEMSFPASWLCFLCAYF